MALAYDANLAPILVQVNPLLYREYVYDIELGMYYLQSRYYDPNLGRFINADAYASTGQGVLGNNMFAYCGNSPIIYSDRVGTRREICMTDLVVPGSLYITDQAKGPWSELPLGESTVAEMGCGIVAIYNAMVSLGDARSFMESYNFFANRPTNIIDRGKYGLFFLDISDYFLSEGYYVYITCDPLEIEGYSRFADSCIMLYQYTYYDTSTDKMRNGGHYIDYSWYNDQYVAHNVGRGVSEFASPFCFGHENNRYFVIAYFILDFKIGN